MGTTARLAVVASVIALGAGVMPSSPAGSVVAGTDRSAVLTRDWGAQLGTSGQDIDGRVAVVGSHTFAAYQTADADPYEIHLARYADDGSPVWERVVAGPGGEYSYLQGLAADRGGVVLVEGRTALRAGDYDSFHLRRFGLDGAPLWDVDSRTLDIPEWLMVNDVTIVAGDLYLAGYTITGDHYEGVLLRVSLTTGTLLRKRRMVFGDSFDLTSVSRSGDELVVVGNSEENDEGDSQIVVRRINRHTLATRWTATIDTAERDTAREVVARGRHIYVTGLTNGRLGGTRGGFVLLVAYEQSGARLWQRQFGNGRGVLAATREGPVVAINGPEYYQIELRAFDPSGRPRARLVVGDVGIEQFVSDATANQHGVRLAGATRGATYGEYRGGFADVTLARYQVP